MVGLILSSSNQHKLIMGKLANTLLFGTIFTILFLITGLLQAQQNNDTISEKLTELKDRMNGLDERLLTAESDLSKHNKIKFSGYTQAQWEHFESPTAYPNQQFTLRRVRLKTTYEAAEGVKFVLQPDFAPGSFSLKDAYVVVNDRWTKQFALTLGQFNRPNYEVEYSSSQREVPERSRLIRALYPGERAIGAKLEYSSAKLPLKIQFALLNGNDNATYRDAVGSNTNVTNKDFDNFKDIMVRGTYGFKLGSFGGLDVGAHVYLGSIKATTDTIVKGDFTKDQYIKIGDPLKRSWAGLEFQLYADVLGGMSLKGEYIMGTNATPGYSGSTSVSSLASVFKNDTLFNTTTITNTTTRTPNFTTKFSGYYLYFIKNVGVKNQFALRYDVYDPNTDVSGNDIKSTLKYENSSTKTTSVSTTTNNLVNTTTTKTVSKTSIKSGVADLAYSTLTIAWHYYFDDNIRLTLAYEMPVNETVGKDTNGTSNLSSSTTINNVVKTLNYNTVFPQNTLTFRIQAKF